MNDDSYKLSELGLHAAAPDDLTLQAGDDLEAQAQTQGRVIAAYYTSLRQNGVPLELAEKMTLEWHGLKEKFWLSKAHAEAR